MNAEIVNRFLNQKVKLIKDNFAIYGTIISVEEDCILFRTKTTTSVIRLDVIQEITPLDGGSC